MSSYKDHRMPRVYKEGAKILKEVVHSKRGLKDVIYSNRNKMLYKKLFVLLDKYLDNQNSVNKFIEETSLTQNVKDEFVAKILCTELLHGRKSLPSIENYTMMAVTKAYDLYCEQNEHSDIKNKNFTLNNKTTDCDKQDATSYYIAKKKKLRFVRVNTLMISIDECVVQLLNDGFVQLPSANSYEEFLDTLGEYTDRSFDEQEYFIRDYHLNDVLVFLQSTQFHNYALYKNGSLFLQDKASCVPTHLLSPPPNSVVFDTCAAPGNKTLHLAAYMQNQGKVYAVDKDPKRFKYMKEVIDLAQGSQVVEPILSDIFEIKMAEYSDVEYVLVDPSCSGTGITERAKIDNHREMSSGRIKNLSGFQKDLLGRVCSYFPNVKRIVYCTCSVQEEENEQVLEDIIAKHGDRFQVEDLTRHPALVGWKHFGSEKYTQGKKCFYALPQDYCTGFFAAVLNRKDNARRRSEIDVAFETEATNSSDQGSSEFTVDSSISSGIKKKKKEKIQDHMTSLAHRKKERKESVNTEDACDDSERIESKNNEKKKKKKHKRKNIDNDLSSHDDIKKHESEENCDDTTSLNDAESESVVITKKKKKNHKRNDDIS